MIRTILTKTLNTARFSKISILDGTQADVQGMQNISKLPFYQSFREGLNLTMQNQLQQANKCFQQSLNLLQERREQLSEHYMHIYKKLIANNLALNKIDQAEKNMYGLIKMKKKNNYQTLLVYDDYNTLFQLFLKYNPQKAILLGRALLSEKELESMSLKHKKQFLFNLGNAYFLAGNYADAKSKYSECLESDPNPEMRVRVLNNLGLACWWHKNPLVSEESVESFKHKAETIDSEFKQTRQILLKALERSQNPDSLSSEQEKYLLKQVLNEYELDLKAKFRQPLSVLPMYNLVQYYMNNQPAERIKILFWLRTLLQLSKAVDNQPIFDEIYTTLCILNNDKIQLESFLKVALQKYKDKFQEIYFSKLMGFISSDKDRGLSQRLSKRVAQLQSHFLKEDPYIFKRKNLSEENLQL